VNSINFRASLAMLVVGLALGACENPVTPEHHEEPEGLVIRAGSTELIRVVGALGAGVVTGELAVAAGQQTPELTVTFIDEHGDDLAFDDEYSLDVASTSSATATWQGTPAEGFTGLVAGHAAGGTTLVFQLYHGPVGTGHAEGGAYVVPVTVTAMQP
jgi:hypothetical protein